MMHTAARRVAAATKTTSGTRSMSSAARVLGGFLGEAPGQLPATQEFPGVSAALQPRPAAAFSDAEVTTLANGVQVVSVETSAPLASFGVYVNAGSRYEDDSSEGIANVMQRLAFKSSTSRSHLRLTRDLEDAGVSTSASFGRESLAYTAECSRDDLEAAAELVVDSVVNPLFAAWEVEAWQYKQAQYDLGPQSAPAIRLEEALHAAAFLDDSPLGHSKFCPDWKLGSFTGDDLRSYMAANFAPSRISVVAAGCSNSQLASIAQNLLGDLPAGEASSTPASAYVGGEDRQRGPGLAHYAVAFEAPSLNSSVTDIAATWVLHAMLGDTVVRREGLGNRQSRLAKLELANPEIGVASGYTQLYSDTGLFGITATADAEFGASSFDAVAGALKDILGGPVAADELARAKNQLKRNAAEASGSAQVTRAHLGAWAAAGGSIVNPSEFAAAVDSVTADDVARIGGFMLSKAPAVAAIGSIRGVPRFDAVEKFFR